MNDYGTTTDFAGLDTAFIVGFAIVYIAIFVFIVYLYCRVARKAGWSPWAGLLVLIPFVNLVFMLIFVFAEWPLERENRLLRAQLASMNAHGSAGGGYDAPHSAFSSLPYHRPTAQPDFSPQDPGATSPIGTEPGFGTPPRSHGPDEQGLPPRMW